MVVTNDELDRLLNNIQLNEPDPDLDGGNINNYSSVNASQVPLFLTVGPPTEEPVGGTSLAPKDEGILREVHASDQPCLHKTKACSA